MVFCPKCGNDVGDGMFCPNCGAKQGEKSNQYGHEASSKAPVHGRRQPQYQPPRRGSGVMYDETICLVLCCCVTPVAALLYYLLTEHPENNPGQRY